MFHYPNSLQQEALLLHLVTKECSCQSVREKKSASSPYLRATMNMHIALNYTQTEVK